MNVWCLCAMQLADSSHWALVDTPPNKVLPRCASVFTWLASHPTERALLELISHVHAFKLIHPLQTRRVLMLLTLRLQWRFWNGVNNMLTNLFGILGLLETWLTPDKLHGANFFPPQILKLFMRMLQCGKAPVLWTEKLHPTIHHYGG